MEESKACHAYSSTATVLRLPQIHSLVLLSVFFANNINYYNYFDLTEKRCVNRPAGEILATSHSTVHHIMHVSHSSFLIGHNVIYMTALFCISTSVKFLHCDLSVFPGL